MRLSREAAYAVLGLQENCSEEEVRKAYKLQALKWHPDKNANSTESTEKFKAISEAYARLSKPDEDDEFEMDEDMFDDDMFDDLPHEFFFFFARMMGQRTRSGYTSMYSMYDEPCDCAQCRMKARAGARRPYRSTYSYRESYYAPSSPPAPNREKAEKARQAQSSAESAAMERWLQQVLRLKLVSSSDYNIQAALDDGVQVPTGCAWEVSYRREADADGAWTSALPKKNEKVYVGGLRPGTEYVFRARPGKSGTYTWSGQPEFSGAWGPTRTFFTTGVAPDVNQAGGKKGKKKQAQSQYREDDHDMDEKEQDRGDNAAAAAPSSPPPAASKASAKKGKKGKAGTAQDDPEAYAAAQEQLRAQREAREAAAREKEEAKKKERERQAAQERAAQEKLKQEELEREKQKERDRQAAMERAAAEYDRAVASAAAQRAAAEKRKEREKEQKEHSAGTQDYVKPKDATKSKSKADTDAKTKAEVKGKAAAEAKARALVEEKARAEAEEKEREERERARAEAEAQARVEEEARMQAEVEAERIRERRARVLAGAKYSMPVPSPTAPADPSPPHGKEGAGLTRVRHVEPCKYFLRGNCMRGDACWYLHDQGPRNLEQKYVRKTKITPVQPSIITPAPAPPSPSPLSPRSLSAPAKPLVQRVTPFHPSTKSHTPFNPAKGPSLSGHNDGVGLVLEPGMRGVSPAGSAQHSVGHSVEFPADEAGSSSAPANNRGPTPGSQDPISALEEKMLAKAIEESLRYQQYYQTAVNLNELDFPDLSSTVGTAASSRSSADNTNVTTRNIGGHGGSNESTPGAGSGSRTGTEQVRDGGKEHRGDTIMLEPAAGVMGGGTNGSDRWLSGEHSVSFSSKSGYCGSSKGLGTQHSGAINDSHRPRPYTTHSASEDLSNDRLDSNDSGYNNNNGAHLHGRNGSDGVSAGDSSRNERGASRLGSQGRISVHGTDSGVMRSKSGSFDNRRDRYIGSGQVSGYHNRNGGIERMDEDGGENSFVIGRDRRAVAAKKVDLDAGRGQDGSGFGKAGYHSTTHSSSDECERGNGKSERGAVGFEGQRHGQDGGASSGLDRVGSDRQGSFGDGNSDGSDRRGNNTGGGLPSSYSGRGSGRGGARCGQFPGRAESGRGRAGVKMVYREVRRPAGQHVGEDGGFMARTDQEDGFTAKTSQDDGFTARLSQEAVQNRGGTVVSRTGEDGSRSTSAVSSGPGLTSSRPVPMPMPVPMPRSSADSSCGPMVQSQDVTDSKGFTHAGVKACGFVQGGGQQNGIDRQYSANAAGNQAALTGATAGASLLSQLKSSGQPVIPLPVPSATGPIRPTFGSDTVAADISGARNSVAAALAFAGRGTVAASNNGNVPAGRAPHTSMSAFNNSMQEDVVTGLEVGLQGENRGEKVDPFAGGFEAPNPAPRLSDRGIADQQGLRTRDNSDDNLIGRSRESLDARSWGEASKSNRDGPSYDIRAMANANTSDRRPISVTSSSAPPYPPLPLSLLPSAPSSSSAIPRAMPVPIPSPSTSSFTSLAATNPAASYATPGGSGAQASRYPPAPPLTTGIPPAAPPVSHTVPSANIGNSQYNFDATSSGSGVHTGVGARSGFAAGVNSGIRPASGIRPIIVPNFAASHGIPPVSAASPHHSMPFPSPSGRAPVSLNWGGVPTDTTWSQPPPAPANNTYRFPSPAQAASPSPSFQDAPGSFALQQNGVATDVVLGTLQGSTYGTSAPVSAAAVGGDNCSNQRFARVNVVHSSPAPSAGGNVGNRPWFSHPAPVNSPSRGGITNSPSVGAWNGHIPSQPMYMASPSTRASQNPQSDNVNSDDSSPNSLLGLLLQHRQASIAKPVSGRSGLGQTVASSSPAVPKPATTYPAKPYNPIQALNVAGPQAVPNSQPSSQPPVADHNFARPAPNFTPAPVTRHNFGQAAPANFAPAASQRTNPITLDHRAGGVSPAGITLHPQVAQSQPYSPLPAFLPPPAATRVAFGSINPATVQ